MKSGASKLDVYILSRNRAVYLKQAIVSVLCNRSESFTLTVSDNSESDEVQELVKNEFQNIQFIRRKPVLSVYDHFNQVLNESQAEYLVVFHDDDIMMTNYVQEALRLIELDSSLVAVGVNALELHEDEKTSKNYMKMEGKVFQLTSALQVLWPYISIAPMRAPPFPGYIYRRSLLTGCTLDPNKGGKYCDVSFLMSLLKQGPIGWSSQPLMYYRFHQSNDTKLHSVAAQIKLCNYFVAQNIFAKHSFEILNFKFKYHLKWVLADAFQMHGSRLLSKKYRPVLKFITIFFLLNIIKLINPNVSKIYD
jgi:hypothetical protein